MSNQSLAQSLAHISEQRDEPIGEPWTIPVPLGAQIRLSEGSGHLLAGATITTWQDQ